MRPRIAIAAASLCAALAMRGGAAEIYLSESGSAFELAGDSDVATREIGHWPDVFTVRVHESDAGEPLPPMAGSYEVIGERVRFTPKFPLTPGVRYRASFSLAPEAEVTFLIPKGPPQPPTTVVAAIYPGADQLPENLLKFYLHFSAPMSQGDAYRHIHLLDAAGEPVDLPFLELAEELWDPDGVRLTLFLDPARVKRGLVPNEESGRALHAGETYTLRIDPAWHDAAGRPLKSGGTKQFAAIPADFSQPDPKHWKLEAPAAGTRDPLELTFPAPLDRGLLGRMLRVEVAGAGGADGEISISEGERKWAFTPAEPWRPGAHQLVVDNLLEDLAGNSVARPFEVTAATIGRLPPSEKSTRMPFVPGAAPQPDATGFPSRTLTQQENWPQWRGPGADGHSPARDLPITWNGNDSDGIIWKTPLPGTGAGTPVIWGERIFLTSQIGSDPKSRGPGEAPVVSDDDVTFSVQCLGATDGRPLWERRIPAAGELTPTHTLHNQSTPSCVTDGERVIALFATGQLFAFDFDGNILWQRDLAREYSPFELLWGHASSPVLHGDSLFVLCDHNPAAYLLALDKKTGRERWRADRGKALRSYSSPLVIEVDGDEQLIVNSNPGIDAYDLASGEKLWGWEEFCKVPVPVPAFANGVLYASRGYTSGPFMAIRPGEPKPLWRIPSRAPYVSSILHHDGILYLAGEGGQVFTCDAATGERLWTRNFSGKCFWASPVYAGGNVYLLAEDGETIVLKAGREPEVLSTNPLGEPSRGSPAIAAGRIFIRTGQHLFCVGRR